MYLFNFAIWIIQLRLDETLLWSDTTILDPHAQKGNKKGTKRGASSDTSPSVQKPPLKTKMSTSTHTGRGTRSSSRGNGKKGLGSAV